MIRLVVFDWDGTLMDSEARIVHALQTAFAAHGARTPTRDAIRDIIGLDLSVAIAHIDAALAPASIAAIAHSYRQTYPGLHAIPSPLFAGVEAALTELAEQGIALAVATGKSRAGLDRAMSEAGIDRYFVTCRCADESAPKPDPAMLREILTDLDIAPHEAIMIGDTEFDLAMAAAARTHAGAVTYGAHARARLLRSNPAFVIDHLNDLADQIRQLDRQLSQPL